MKVRAALGALAVLGGFATTTFAGERRVEVRNDRPVIEARHDERVFTRDDHRDFDDTRFNRDHRDFDHDRFDRDHRVVVHMDDWNRPTLDCR